MQKSYFIMHRKGTFKATFMTDNQCKVKGHKKYNYDIRIKCTTKLDAQGFVIDHVEIDNAIQQFVEKHKISSCEVLAQQLVAAVKYVLNVHGVEYLGIIFNILPKGKDVMADMTYVEEFK